MYGDSITMGMNNAGQGLALAIEDAVVLAWHLRRQGIAQSALRRYPGSRLLHCISVLVFMCTFALNPDWLR